jgi:ribosomal protein L29
MNIKELRQKPKEELKKMVDDSREKLRQLSLICLPEK